MQGDQLMARLTWRDDEVNLSPGRKNRLAHSSAPPAEKVTDIRREPLGNQRDYEDKKRAV
jgi:hypothetical protein